MSAILKFNFTMMSFFLSAYSYLRPDDDSLSADGKSRVQLYRLISFLEAITIPGLSLLYRHSYLGPAIPAWAYLGVSGLFGGLFAASYVSREVRQHYVPLMWGIQYIEMFWLTAAAVVKGFTIEYVLAILIAYATIGVIIELGARSFQPIVWFLVSGFLMVTGGLLSTPAPQVSPSILLGMMTVLGLTIGFSLRGRLTIREQRDLLNRLIETSPNAIIRLGQDGTFIQVNGQSEKVLGVEEAELLGRTYNDLEWNIDMFGGDSADATLPFAEVLETGTSIQGAECSIRWPDGTRRFLSISGAPLRRENGKAVFHLQDITNREKRERLLRDAKEEAEAASRMKSSFLANMSHEIRTPLTSIIGFAEAVGTEANELELEESSPLPKYADLIEQGGKRLLDTLEGVLNLSKLEAGQMDLDIELVDLAAQAHQAADELRPKATEKDIDVQLNAEDSSVWAEADKGGVQIVVRNLVSNAIKYTQEGGHVWIHAYSERDWAVLEVEDNGIGMEPEIAEDLFEPFRQASQGLNRQYKGTGVGLAVTREATEQMEGKLEVETEKGEGSRFIVQLPREETKIQNGQSKIDPN